MKTLFFALVFSACLSVSCGGMFLADDSRRALELPELPGAWEAALGPPSWRIEWFDGEGLRQAAVLPEAGGLEISMPGTMSSPVLALPFWPEKGIPHGVFRPAGAIFPFDAPGGRLALSWRGGVDATLFIELARAAGEAGSQGEGPPPSGAAALRLPWNFDWPRFRELFEEEGPLAAEVRDDPWLADWRGIAERTWQSGFDRRRIVPEPRGELELPLGPGPWIGASPFAAPLVFEEGPVFPVGAAADTWVSAEGLLRASEEAWIWREF